MIRHPAINRLHFLHHRPVIFAMSHCTFDFSFIILQNNECSHQKLHHPPSSFRTLSGWCFFTYDDALERVFPLSYRQLCSVSIIIQITCCTIERGSEGIIKKHLIRGVDAMKKLHLLLILLVLTDSLSGAFRLWSRCFIQ